MEEKKRSRIFSLRHDSCSKGGAIEIAGYRFTELSMALIIPNFTSINSCSRQLCPPTTASTRTVSTDVAAPMQEMESLNDTVWDVVICGTGFQQSLLAL